VGLPEECLEVNVQMVKAFEQRIKAKTKLYKDATHKLHWNKPDEVVEDAANWFK